MGKCLKGKHKIQQGAALLVTWMLLLFLLPAVPGKAADAETPRTVRVSCNINNALYLDENGDPAGYCSAYLTTLAAINNWHLEYVEGSWTESVQNLEDGKIDLLFPTQLTEERKPIMGFSSAIGGYQPIGLFARKDSALCYDDYAGFNGLRVALSAGTSNEAAMQAYAEENHFTYKPVYLNTTADKMEALQNGDVDLIVFSTLNDVADGKVVAMLDYLPFYYCTAIENTALLKELNYGMNQMLIRHPDMVQDVFYNFINPNVSFAYTAAERHAMLEYGTISVGIYADTAPLMTVDENGEPHGIYVDLLARVEEISGLNIRIIPLERTADLFSALESGKVDFVLSTDKRELTREGVSFVRSEGIMDYYLVGITRSDYVLDKQDPILFAMTGGRRYLENQIAQLYPQARFSYYSTAKECLNAVQRGKADATLLNTWEYNYQSKNQRFENLIEWENTRDLSQTVFFSLQSENKLIRSVLDKAIEQLPNAEKERIITANLNGAYTEYDLADHLYVARYGLATGGCVLLATLICLVMYLVMRKRSMRALKEKNLQLESANAAKDRFLSRMSHELRTPLNAINGYAIVMEQDLDAHHLEENKMRAQLNSILRAAKYQLAIIADLLDFQKIESGKLVLQPTNVEMAPYMENVVEMLRPEAAEKGVDFTYQNLTPLTETYWMDGVRFQQVLLNILYNAVKFTPAGGKVHMTAEVVNQDENAHTLKFVISDTGIGMSEDFQQHYLFHRFAQEYQGNTSPYEGTGTGLAMTREILHLMGGEITCSSARDVGSTFTIVVTVKRGVKKRRRAASNYDAYDLTGVHILLCEDNKMNQDIEKRLLERMHCRVDLADDGAIGLEKFAQSRPGTYQVVLMDIRMPNMDGLEATRAIRALDHPDAKTVTIMAVSANAFEEDVQKSLAAGMNEHLAKPVDVRVLYRKIKDYCTGSTDTKAST